VRALRLALLLAPLLACAGPRTPDWTREERERAFAEALAAADASPPLRLALVFYERTTNRRFNSIATYHDPALREFFRTPEAFADYYADLAQALADAHFEANRPTGFEIEDLASEAPGRVRVRVRFIGENGLPLRWWEAALVREDRWEQSEGRWWIVPGKL
jgi:hypothetical protein